MRGMWVVVAIAVGWPSVGMAARGRVNTRQKTVIEFSEAIIEGTLAGPEGSYMVSRKLSRFSTMIQLRMDFKPELLRSADDL